MDRWQLEVASGQRQASASLAARHSDRSGSHTLSGQTERGERKRKRRRGEKRGLTPREKKKFAGKESASADQSFSASFSIRNKHTTTKLVALDREGTGQPFLMVCDVFCSFLCLSLPRSSLSVLCLSLTRRVAAASKQHTSRLALACTHHSQATLAQTRTRRVDSIHSSNHSRGLASHHASHPPCRPSAAGAVRSAPSSMMPHSTHAACAKRCE